MPQPPLHLTLRASSGGRRARRSAMARRCCFSWQGASLLSAARWGFSRPRFADTVVRVSANASPAHQGFRAKAFRRGSRQQALRRKEFVLLRRDPWLVSQTLMQLLYLAPPALMLWGSFADNSAAIVLITPVIVMAAGPLARGLGLLA